MTKNKFCHLIFNGAVATSVLWIFTFPIPVSAQGGFGGPGRYQIANVKSGKVLDINP